MSSFTQSTKIIPNTNHKILPKKYKQLMDNIIINYKNPYDLYQYLEFLTNKYVVEASTLSLAIKNFTSKKYTVNYIYLETWLNSLSTIKINIINSLIIYLSVYDEQIRNSNHICDQLDLSIDHEQFKNGLRHTKVFLINWIIVKLDKKSLWIEQTQYLILKKYLSFYKDYNHLYLLNYPINNTRNKGQIEQNILIESINNYDKLLNILYKYPHYDTGYSLILSDYYNLYERDHLDEIKKYKYIEKQYMQSKV